MSSTVVMFAKAPVPGTVKTRLAAAIGDEPAADLYSAFIDDIADTVARTDARRVVAHTGDAAHPGFARLRELAFDFVRQADGDLGARLDAAIRQQIEHSDHVVVIGSDSPTLHPEHIAEAVLALRMRPVVLGPSFDGGYYLVAVRSEWFRETAPAGEIHPLFRDIQWSTGNVLGQTLRRCRELSCLCDLMAFWYDVDTIEDLDLLRTHLLDYLRSPMYDGGRDVASRTAEILVRSQVNEDPRTP